MQIEQFRYGADNLGYVVHGRKEALAIDGGAVDGVIAFCRRKGLRLKAVSNTHGHPDHTAGTRELVKRSGAVYLDHRKLAQKGCLELEAGIIDVLPTPGHTTDSVTYSVDGSLITGDTLFNGTVGNCFSGDLDGFYRSICMLMDFPGDTMIYAGHDYVRDAMAFARSMEPGNADIDPYLNRYNPYHVFSTIAEEIRVNPYLRFNTPSMIQVLQSRGLPTDSESARWKSVMTLG